LSELAGTDGGLGQTLVDLGPESQRIVPVPSERYQSGHRRSSCKAILLSVVFEGFQKFALGIVFSQGLDDFINLLRGEFQADFGPIDVVGRNPTALLKTRKFSSQ